MADLTRTQLHAKRDHESLPESLFLQRSKSTYDSPNLPQSAPHHNATPIIPPPQLLQRGVGLCDARLYA